jgi:hypothetical protein
MGLNVFGSWWRCNSRIGNMMYTVCDSFMDTLVLSESVGMKGSVMIIIPMVVASVLCGYLF